MNNDYKKILTYIDSLLAVNSSTNEDEIVCEIQYINTLIDRHFQRVFVSSDTNVFHFEKILLFVAIDKIYVRNCYAMTLLIAIARNNNEKIFLIVWALMKSEIEFAWRWFLRLLKKIYSRLDENESRADFHRLIIISNRDKECRQVDDEFRFVVRAFCIWHLVRNMQKYHEKKCVRIVKRLTHVNSNIVVERAKRDVMKKNKKICECAKMSLSLNFTRNSCFFISVSQKRYFWYDVAFFSLFIYVFLSEN